MQMSATCTTTVTVCHVHCVLSPDCFKVSNRHNNLRPVTPRYATTWDTDIVIKYLKELDHSHLKTLNKKLTMLLALITAQRAHTLSKLKISEMTERDGHITFCIGEALKTKAAGTARIEIKPFDMDKAVCVVTLIKMYIRRTRAIILDDTVFLSFVKPHRAVHVDTIRRWIMDIMSEAGIETASFKPHSTRAASTSKAKAREVPLHTIMNAAMWSGTSTFAKFYDKPIVTDKHSFSSAFLDIVTD